MTSTHAILCIAVLLIAGCAAGPRALSSADRIVFLGDSITEQGALPGGYVSLVRDTLARRMPGVEVLGAGISGNKITDLEARLDRDVISKKPTVVVIYIGINDVWHWALPGHRGTSMEDFDKGLRSVIGRIRASNARVILCTPSVIGEKHFDENAQDTPLARYAAISRRVADEEGVALCDLRRAFIQHLAEHNPSNVDRGILTTDGVHLNAAGNAFVAGQMLEALSKAF
jgi:lysophospholipase L1-like esterase